jgi:acetylornithine deacetylase/succinyl-diaminopimelate desuccinylase-like protein
VNDAPRADLDALRADVEALAAIERRSASAGERESARLVAERLHAAGAAGVRVEPFRYGHTFGHAHALMFGAAMLGRLPAAAALALFELDFSGRAQPLRRVLPAGEGANVIARVPAAGEARRTLVLVAHHDAAHTGLMWHPALAGGATRHGRPPFSLLPELAMAAIAAGPRRLRAPARALLGLAGALSLEVARGATVPGASDNATGVAAVIELVRRVAAEPLADTEVIAVVPGCEEAGMGGMAAWMRAEGRALDPRSTLVLGLDTLGAGEPMVVSAEGPLWAVRFRDEDIALVDRGAAAAGEPPPRRFRIGGFTDPALARLAGLPAVSLLSLAGNGFSNYHLPTDVPENVDWDGVGRCLAIAEGTARVWADGRR